MVTFPLASAVKLLGATSLAVSFSITLFMDIMSSSIVILFAYISTLISLVGMLKLNDFSCIFKMSLSTEGSPNESISTPGI